MWDYNIKYYSVIFPKIGSTRARKTPTREAFCLRSVWGSVLSDWSSGRLGKKIRHRTFTPFWALGGRKTPYLLPGCGSLAVQQTFCLCESDQAEAAEKRKNNPLAAHRRAPESNLGGGCLLNLLTVSAIKAQSALAVRWQLSQLQVHEAGSCCSATAQIRQDGSRFQSQ